MKKTSHPGFELCGPLHMWQVLCHWTIKAEPKVPTYQYQFHSELTRTHSCWSLLLVWQICSLNWDLDMNSFVGTQCIWLWWSSVKILTTVAGVLGLNPGCEFYYFFMLTSLGDQVQIWFSQFLLGLHMWNFELRYGQFLLESCNPNLNQTGPFSGYIFPTVNSKNLQ